jgi:hypothetical protein
MAWDNDEEILRARYKDLQLEQAAIAADYQRAKLEEDGEALAAVIERHDANYMRFQSLNNAALQMQRGQAQQIDASFAGSDLKPSQIDLARKYGLTADQMGAAIAATSDPRIGDAERAMSYRQNLDKMRAMRASGQYTDAADLQGRR